VTTVVVVFIIAGLFLLGIALLAACSHGRRRPDLAPGRLYRLFHRKPWTPFDRHSYVDHPRLKAEGWHTIGYMTDEGIK
jgi:hypothetical protein